MPEGIINKAVGAVNTHTHTHTHTSTNACTRTRIKGSTEESKLLVPCVNVCPQKHVCVHVQKINGMPLRVCA